MRLLFLALALLLMAAPAGAQGIEASSAAADSLRIEQPGAIDAVVLQAGPRLVRGDRTLAGGGPLSGAWGFDLAPVVGSVPEAVPHARAYERLRAPRLAADLAGAGLLTAVLVDVGGGDFLGAEGRWAALGGFALSQVVGFALGRRQSQERAAAVEAYNASLRP